MRLSLTIKVYKSHFYLSYLSLQFFTLRCVSCQYESYMSFYICLCFVLPHPPTLAALSDSHGSCKMKATALLHVTLPTLPFLFHWPQTPDFSEAKNRLLQTLTPPPRCPSPLSLFSSRCTGVYWEVSVRCAHSLLPCVRQSPPVSIQSGGSLCVRETSESFMV